MKIQKLIEVEVCENCGSELHSPSDLRECDCCEKKMCYRCEESVTIRIIHSTPKMNRGSNGEYYSSSIIREKQRGGRFCTDCAEQLAEALGRFGIAKEPEREETGLEV